MAVARQGGEGRELLAGIYGWFTEGFDTSDLIDAKALLEKLSSYARRLRLAWICCDYADMLLDRNNEGARANSITLLDESLAISSELGMRPLMERLRSQREMLGA